MSKEKPNPIIIVSITKDNKIEVRGPLENKSFCIQVLAEAIKIVVAHQPKVVIPNAGLRIPGVN